MESQEQKSQSISLSQRGLKTSPSQNLTSKDTIVSKISSALKIKYRSFFQSIGYKDKDLINDVDQFLTTKYQSKPPKEVFKPTEIAILTQIQSKYNVTIPIDGNEGIQVKPRPLQNSSSLKKSSSSIQNKSFSNKLKLQKKNFSVLNIDTKNEPSDPFKPPRDVIKITTSSPQPHELLDKLKFRMEKDVHAKYIKEQNRKYEELEKQRLTNKKQEQKEFTAFLKEQMVERENQRKQYKEQDKALRESMIKHYKSYIENEKLNRIKKQKHMRDLQLDFMIQSKTEKENNKLKEINYTMNPRGYFNDDISVSNQQKFREKFITDVAKYQKECEQYQIQQNEKKKIEDEAFLKELNEIQKKDDLRTNSVKQNVLSRMHRQDKIQEYMKGLYNSNKNIRIPYQVDKYLKEKEEQDKRKQLEYEMADMKRKEKIQEMKQSLDLFIQNKQNEKNKQKEDEIQIKGINDKMYNEYINEENEKRRKKEEQQKQYREILLQQINDNKKREREEYINSFGIQYGKVDMNN